jgi:hypothetical protein
VATAAALASTITWTLIMALGEPKRINDSPPPRRIFSGILALHRAESLIIFRAVEIGGERTPDAGRPAAGSGPTNGRHGRPFRLGCVVLRLPSCDTSSQHAHQFLFRFQDRLRLQLSIVEQATGSMCEAQVPTTVRELGVFNRHIVFVEFDHINTLSLPATR